MGKNTKRRCVFCNRDNVTKEHVIPSWVLMRLAPDGQGGPYQHTSGNGEAEERRWLSPRVDFTVKRVCRTCNSGWMSAEIELPNIDRLAQMFKGETVVLDPHARSGIAAWIYKTSAMALFRGSGRPSNAHLRHLYSTHRAPEEAGIFLARFDPVSDVMVDGFSQLLKLAPMEDVKNVDPSSILSAEILKLRIDRLLMICVLVGGGKTIVRPSAANDSRLAPIWPLQDGTNVVWPPEAAVTSEKEWKSLTGVLLAPQAP